MTLRSLIILVVAVALIACGKDDKKKGGEEPAPTPGPAEKAPPPKAAEPYTGPLDHARLEQAKNGVKPFQKWDEANAHLMATVGAPQETEGNNSYWYVLDGDSCHELSVENNNGEVGAVGLGTYDKAMKSKYDKCLAHSGGGGEPAPAAGASGGDGKPAPKKAAKGGDDKGGDDKGDDDDDEGGW